MRFFKQSWGAACLLLLFLSAPAQAKVTGFMDGPKGVTLGGGLYYFLIDNNNRFDPIPSLAPTGTTITGSANQLLLPAKVGFFMQRGKLNIDLYFRYLANLRRNFTAAGNNTGTGYLTFSSYGAGANLGVALYQRNRFQFNFVGNGEVVFQRARATFTPDVGAEENLKLKATSYLAGIGLQPEIWLGDMWTLSLFGGYQHGFDRYWEIEKAATFFGSGRSVGALLDANGNQSYAQFGGFLVEVTLKLSFQQ